MSSAASRALRPLAARSRAGPEQRCPRTTCGARASSASCTVSRTVSSGNSVAAWNVRPEPGAGASVRGELADVAARAARRCPTLGHVAADRVEQRRLAGAVRADEADDLARHRRGSRRSRPRRCRRSARVSPWSASTLPSALTSSAPGSTMRVQRHGRRGRGLRRRARAAASRASAGSMPRSQ